MAPKSKTPATGYDGPMEGDGNFFFPDGALYTGAWKMLLPEAEDAVDGVLKPKRVRHGHGKFQDHDNSYVGSFHEDCFDGSGTFTFASGSAYSGMWKQGQYCGQDVRSQAAAFPGCMAAIDFSKHVQGKYEWPDGRKYEGEFLANAPHGEGTYTDQEGRSWSGKFHNGSGPGLTENLP